jgi:hypothetical protein
MGHRTASRRAIYSRLRLLLLIFSTLAIAALAVGRPVPKATALGAHTVSKVTSPCTAAATIITCNITTDLAVAQGGTLVLTLGIPPGATFVSSTPIGTCPQVINNGATPPTVTYGPCTAQLPPGQVISEAIILPSATGACTNADGSTFLCATVTATYNANGPVSPSSATGSRATPDAITWLCQQFLVSGLVHDNSVTYVI